MILLSRVSHCEKVYVTPHFQSGLMHPKHLRHLALPLGSLRHWCLWLHTKYVQTSPPCLSPDGVHLVCLHPASIIAAHFRLLLYITYIYTNQQSSSWGCSYRVFIHTLPIFFSIIVLGLQLQSFYSHIYIVISHIFFDHRLPETPNLFLFLFFIIPLLTHFPPFHLQPIS